MDKLDNLIETEKFGYDEQEIREKLKYITGEEELVFVNKYDSNYKISIRSYYGEIENIYEYDEPITNACLSHRSYDFENNPKIDINDFDSWQEVKEHLIKEYEPVVIYPVYLYDHSGLAISLTPFSCSWDSGQLGFIYISKKKAEQNNIDDVAEADRLLRLEFEEYSQYVSGDTLLYSVEIDEKEINEGGNYRDVEEVLDFIRDMGYIK